MKTKILIVEDEVDLAANLKEILENLNYEVIGSFTNGQDVMAFLMRNTPDIILMDILIEGEIDGIDLTYQIRDKFNIPVVFLTAYSDESILNRITKVMYDGYILKPFTTERLKSNIYLALQEFNSKKSKKIYTPTLKIRDKGYLVPVPQEDILFLEADGLYTKVITKSKKYMLRDILKDVGEQLIPEKFKRVHKSYIVNIEQIDSINAKEIIVKQQIIPIRRGLYKELKIQMNIE